MISSILSMTPKPDRLGDLVSLFESQRIFDRAKQVEGCIDVMMLQRPDHVIVLGFWDDADAYQRWIDHPERGNGNDELNQLLAQPLSTEAVGGLFDVALSTTSLSGESA